MNMFASSFNLGFVQPVDLSGEIVGQALAPFVMIPSWLDGWLAQNEARKKERALFQVGGGRGKEI